MKLIYNVDTKPKQIGYLQMALFSLQQLLAIMAATILVPAIIGRGMSQTAALFGAGVGTLVYLFLTKFKSPVFLGSSFAFLGSMGAAFAGGVSMSAGYLGLILGAIMAGLVYVVISIVIKFAGVNWINKLMPIVVIGPTVALIGLSLAGTAVSNLTQGGVVNKYGMTVTSPYVALICGLVTLFATIAASVYGKKMAKMIPFIIGIAAGYIVATLFTVVGKITDNSALLVIDFSKFNDIQWVPDFTFLTAFSGDYSFGSIGSFGAYLGTIAMAYVPVAFVVFAEHIADHKNLSTIIEKDLLEEPGLHRTLLGDGIGSMAGALFGGCPNTTYGECVGCVAISGNASVCTIALTAIMAIAISFFGPFATLLATIPACVIMGGICVALYGFIAVSGLKMVQKVDLNDNRNLFVVSVILITGIGGLSLTFGKVTITNIACALILGIITNVLVNLKKTDK